MLLSLLVGKRDAHAQVAADFQLVSDDPRVEALGVEDVLKESKEAYDLVQAYLDEVDRWKGDKWYGNRALAEAQVAKFKGSFQTLIDYHESLLIIVEQHKRSKTTAKKADARKQRAWLPFMVDAKQRKGVGCPPLACKGRCNLHRSQL